MSGEPWLVLPTYNEAENIEAIVAAASGVLARATAPAREAVPGVPSSVPAGTAAAASSVPAGEAVRHATHSSPGASSASGRAPERPPGDARFHILVVDDGSPDGTGEIADRLAGEHEWMHVLHRSEKNGIGPAYLAGFRHALDHGAGYVMEMDSDFSHDPADLARLLAAVDRDVPGSADLALGSRYIPGGGVSDWGMLRRFVSEGGSTYARIVLGLQIRDLTGGFKCFRREVLEAIHFDGVRSQGYAFQVELTYRAVRARFRVVEVPIVFRDRQQGQSKMSWRIAAEAMWLVPRLRLRQQAEQ